MTTEKASGTGTTGTGSSKPPFTQMGDVSKKSGAAEKTGELNLSSHTMANIAGANPAAGKYPNTTNVYKAKNASTEHYAYESFSGSTTPLAQMGDVQKKATKDQKQGVTGHGTRVKAKASGANPASGKIPTTTDEPKAKYVGTDNYAYESFSGSTTPLSQMGNVQKKANKDQKQGVTGHGSAVKKKASGANPASGKIPSTTTEPKAKYVNSDNYAYE